MALASAWPPSRVATQVRGRLTDLQKQMAPPPAAPRRPLGFVAVPSAPSWPQPTATTPLELCRADGTRRSIHTPTAPLPLATVVRACLEVHEGSHSPPPVALVPWAGTAWATTPSRGPSTSAAPAPPPPSTS